MFISFAAWSQEPSDQRSVDQRSADQRLSTEPQNGDGSRPVPAATPTAEQQSKDPLFFVGMQLDELIELFGTPRTVAAARELTEALNAREFVEIPGGWFL